MPHTKTWNENVHEWFLHRKKNQFKLEATDAYVKVSVAHPDEPSTMLFTLTAVGSDWAKFEEFEPESNKVAGMIMLPYTQMIIVNRFSSQLL